MLNFLSCRIFHWGPILGMSIIKCITITTLYMTDMWLPFHRSPIALLNHLTFLSLVGLTLYNFFCAIFIGPGHVPPNWKPKSAEDVKFLQECTICESYKCPRAHHCRKCDKCVLKMDHHCPWINNCVGHVNQLYFTLFLLFAVLGSIQATFLLGIALYRGYHATWYFYNEDPDSVVFLSFSSLLFSVFSIGLGIGVMIAVGGLFVVQMKIILRNMTSIEEWIVTKAENRERNDTFVYPYDLGKWNNFKQIFMSRTLDGIEWPVKEGCSQYALTAEQLIQKQEKRIRSRPFKTIESYNGRWLPLFSQGWRTCLRIPFTDEPRLPLNVDDVINVTRWKKYWLYGEKIHPLQPPKLKLRGWFPRRCVVPYNFTSIRCDVSSAGDEKKLN
ncbi:palmitoyltransferase ZDHHC6 [Brevipalpus obovatus]|uniref:palmitoyltransferase ZDHHC6 n=1 Tax=Brevipalpus obovatus TaxID=246614 RepID=UPI003D9FAE90